jgi:ferritin
MISKKMAKALNEQLNFELYSSYVYVAMGSWLKSQNLNGFANWMEVQVKEELDHTMKFYQFLHDTGSDVEFQAIPKPKNDYISIEEVFEVTLEHEREVTKRINALIDLALSESDHATNARLQWFITEQIEEEANVLGILQQIRLVKDSPNSLLMLDRELATRNYNPAPND